jgi:hypothetical protein
MYGARGEGSNLFVRLAELVVDRSRSEYCLTCTSFLAQVAAQTRIRYLLRYITLVYSLSNILSTGYIYSQRTVGPTHSLSTGVCRCVAGRK